LSFRVYKETLVKVSTLPYQLISNSPPHSAVIIVECKNKTPAGNSEREIGLESNIF